MPKAKRSKAKRSTTASRTVSTSQTAQDEEGPQSGSGVCCRVCMRWDSESLMVQLFTEHCVGSENDSTLAEVLAIVGGVKVSEGDRLPQVCCLRCRRDVEAAFRLRTLCQSSDAKLRGQMFFGGDAAREVVVKSEYDGQLRNPLEEEDTVCRPETEELFPLQDDEQRIDMLIPKLEIFEHEPAESSYWLESDDQEDNQVKNEMDDAEDFDADCSDKDDNQGDCAEPTNPKPKESASRKFPDVFETIPLEGVRCCGCKNIFANYQELYIHGQTAHIAKKIPLEQVKSQCEICFKVFSRVEVLQRHKQVGQNNFRCKTCSEVFASRVRVCTHYERVHGPNPRVTGTKLVICCGCTQRFETMEELKNHSDTVHLPEKLPPNPERPFVCDVCYHNFREEHQLYGHKTRLTKRVKKHRCAECGKAFEWLTQLRDHEIYHSGEPVFQCPHCPKAYSNRESYRKHVAHHTTPQNKYACTLCPKRLQSKKTLREHLLVHSGERPLNCQLCPANFARENCLKKHMLHVHSDERNYLCQICGKCFATSSERTKHIRFHHEKQKPYPCFFCPRGYPRKDYRKRHMVSAHPKEMRANPIPASELGEGKYELPPE